MMTRMYRKRSRFEKKRTKLVLYILSLNFLWDLQMSTTDSRRRCGPQERDGGCSVCLRVVSAQIATLYGGYRRGGLTRG
jgi:hypothetical protein